jgi:hypothetical protein
VPVSACKSVRVGCLLGCPLLREHRVPGLRTPCGITRAASHSPAWAPGHTAGAPAPWVGHLAFRKAASLLLPRDPGAPVPRDQQLLTGGSVAGAAPGPIGGSARGSCPRVSAGRRSPARASERSAHWRPAAARRGSRPCSARLGLNAVHKARERGPVVW